MSESGITSQQEAAVQTAAQALAATDLATLQAFQAIQQNPASTQAQMAAALAALPGQIGDPIRAQAAAQFQQAIVQLQAAVALLVTQTEAVVNGTTVIG